MSANAIIAAAEEAVKTEAPLICSPLQAVARMQEGILSLMQMPRSTVADPDAERSGTALYRSVDPSDNGGVTASYAMLGDVQIAEPGALICFCRTACDRTDHPREAARRIPAWPNTCWITGMLDRVTPRTKMREELITICRMLMRQTPAVRGDLPGTHAGAVLTAPDSTA